MASTLNNNLEFENWRPSDSPEPPSESPGEPPDGPEWPEASNAEPPAGPPPEWVVIETLYRFCCRPGNRLRLGTYRLFGIEPPVVGADSPTLLWLVLLDFCITASAWLFALVVFMVILICIIKR